MSKPRGGPFGTWTPGDRRKRWRQAENTSGIIMLALAIGMIVLGSEYAFSWILAGVLVVLAAGDFASAKRGWKMKEGRPPWADRHDAIARKHGFKFDG